LFSNNKISSQTLGTHQLVVGGTQMQTGSHPNVDNPEFIMVKKGDFKYYLYVLFLKIIQDLNL
jgi:hypothetical protein